jgi:hypothetical protein
MKEFTIKTRQDEKVIPDTKTINKLGKEGAGCKDVKKHFKILI